MNLSRFILVILLISCLYSRKIHAAIKGNGECFSKEGDLKAQILNVTWLPDWLLKVTVQSPTYDSSGCKFAPSAIGHFTFKDNGSGKGYRFSKHAVWANGYNYENTEGDHCPKRYIGSNPYDYTVRYNSKAASSKGASITVALAIYFNCKSKGSDASCFSCDVKYQSIYQ